MELSINSGTKRFTWGAWGVLSFIALIAWCRWHGTPYKAISGASDD